MKPNGQGNSSARAAQGLATLALLKVNFDAGHDHIEMFMPFVLDCIALLPLNNFASEDVLPLIRSKHQLNIPESILATLLTRAARRGYLRRTGGRYIKDSNRAVDTDVASARQRVEREHSNVAQALRTFAATRGLEIPSDEAALALILRFFEQFHVAMLLEDDPGPLFRLNEVVSRRESAIVARFLEETYRSEPARTDYVARMLEGFVLQNTLLLKDISMAGRRFKNLFVYLDTGFILRALGFAGEAQATSSRETLELLMATGAQFGVFEKTIEEIERILRVYERKLASPQGILSLRPTDITRHFVANNYSPSDVAKAIALLRQNLGQLGIRIRDFPKRETRWNSDEGGLTKLLRREEDTDIEPRIMHDVDSVAAILTLRRGLKPHSLDNALVVFATTSMSVVRTIRDWHKNSGETCIPPVVHAWALSNAAWLKKPTATTSQKLHELVALCSAALRPSPRAWKAFLGELKRLEQDSQITSSEHVSLVARELIDRRLSEIEGDSAADVKTISEVIGKARAEEKERTARAVKEVSSVGEQKLAAAEAARGLAEARANSLVEEKRQLELRVIGSVRKIAGVTSKAFFIVVGMLVAAGVALGLPGIFPHSTGLFQLACWTIAALFAVLSTLNLVSGTSVQSLRLQVQCHIERIGTRWLIDRNEGGPSGGQPAQ